MRATGFPRVTLGERDLRILAALEKWGVMGMAQVDGLVFRREAPAEERARLFFNEMDRKMYTRACYKRLRDLELAGYVRGHSFLNHPKAFGLTERGHTALMERGRAMIRGFRRALPEALVRHEMTVNAVGLMIEQFLGLHVRPEIERRTQSARPEEGKPVRATVSDLWIVDEERPLAIEVELTQKAEARYKSLWESFGKVLPYRARVLYITGWPKGVGCLLKLTGKWRANKVYVCSLQEFRASLGRCRFENHESYYAKHLQLVDPESAPVDSRALMFRDRQEVNS